MAASTGRISLLAQRLMWMAHSPAASARSYRPFVGKQGAGVTSRALADACITKTATAIKLPPANDGPHVDWIYPAERRRQRRHARAILLNEVLRDALMHQQPRARRRTHVPDSPEAVDYPSTALSSSASSKRLNGIFRRDQRKRLCVRGGLAECGPTSGDPVKGDLATSRMLHQRFAVRPSPVTMLTTHAGRFISRQISAKASAVSGVNSAGLNTTVLRPPERAQSPRSMSMGKPGDESVPPLRGGVSGNSAAAVRPSGVMIEMSHQPWDIDIAGLSRIGLPLSIVYRTPAARMFWIWRRGVYRYRARGLWSQRVAMASGG